MTNTLELQVVNKNGSIEFNNFLELKASVELTLTKYKGLTLTEDNKKDIKNTKAELNKVAKALNDERISVKKDFIQPLEVFENQIKQITDLIKDVVNSLDTQVKISEDSEKKEKEDALRNYFCTSKDANQIDFINFEDVGLNITLSTSESSLRKQIDSYIEKVLGDLEEISTDPNKDKLLIKYRLNKDIQKSRIELNREIQESEKITKTTEEKKYVETKPTIELDEVFDFDFTVTGTLHEIRLLRDFMDSNKIQYK